MKQTLQLLLLLVCGPIVVAQPTSLEVDQFVYQWLLNHENPAVVGCVVKGQEIIWMDAYGYANVEDDYSATVDTPFMLASVSKTFTGTALLQVIEDNPNVDFSDAASDHLDFEVIHPAYPDTPITLEQLLTHSSGIKDNWNVMPYCDGDCTVALSDFLYGYFTLGEPNYNASANFYNWEPGSTYAYSNIGAALIGLLVESISGMPFNNYCEQNIFAPLCMDNTHWFLSEFSDVSAIATPYDTWSGADPVDHYGYPDYPDGQLRSSIRDMANWLLAQLNDGNFSNQQILGEAMASDAMTVHFGGDQGYIWYQDMVDGDVVWAHNGGDLGVSSDIFISKENNIAVGLISNGDDGLSGLHDDIYAWAKTASGTGAGWPDCALNVDEQRSVSGIGIYPNPAIESLSIEIPEFEGVVKATLLGMDGQRLCTKEVQNHAGMFLDLSGHPSGTYILRLEWGDKQVWRRVVKV
jgi:CubicO group peptidase (beta-lactamase class C family)